MKIEAKCEQCLMNQQAARAKSLNDSIKEAAFLEEIKECLVNRNPEICAPHMVYLFRDIIKKYFGDEPGYAEIKDTYNKLVMDMEEEIEARITASEDPLKTALLYARIGNYIDFGAMNHVDVGEFIKLLDDGANQGIDENVYTKFIRECERAKRFVLVCDNCGEIVLDKLFLKQLKRHFPELSIEAMVRGAEALNDATMEDAAFCHLDEVATIVSNGIGLPGTVWETISEEAKACLNSADVILSKGQGNYESMYGCGLNVYYAFLCKCDLFTERFSVPKFTGMFLQ